MSRFQLACKQTSSIYVSVCVCVHAPELTNFNTDETQTNSGPGAIAHLQFSLLSKTQTRWEIPLFLSFFCYSSHTVSGLGSPLLKADVEAAVQHYNALWSNYAINSAAVWRSMDWGKKVFHFFERSNGTKTICCYTRNEIFDQRIHYLPFAFL